LESGGLESWNISMAFRRVDFWLPATPPRRQCRARPQQNAGEPRPAGGRITDGATPGFDGRGLCLSGRFTEEEPEGASSLLNLRPCRIRYDVTKEWTKFNLLKRGMRVCSRGVTSVTVPFSEDNSERGIHSGVKQRLNSART
jgi:hypothetical protein